MNKTVETEKASGTRKTISNALSKMGTLLALAILLAFFGIASSSFLTVGNLMILLKQASINCLIASGMLVCLITGGIDLSVGYNTVLCSCVVGVLVQRFGVTNPVVLILCGILASTLVGFVNGTLLTRLELPHPFVSTLGVKNVIWGIALLITASTPIGLSNKGIDAVLFLGDKTLFGLGLPVSFLLVLIAYTCFHVFLNKTALGRQIYCVGGNPEAARLSGIRSKNVLTFVYTLSGFMCGIAGIVLCGRIGTASPTEGATFDTEAIAACIIGGASFSGGKGTIWGTLIGALLMATIRNGLNSMQAPKALQYVVIGSVIVAAVTLDVVRNKMEAKARRLAAK
ncbi:MAG: ABC transporter permease [Clostridiales bacterium]|nr:ABC transporter permease [Clostridiales bacterium]